MYNKLCLFKWCLLFVLFVVSINLTSQNLIHPYQNVALPFETRVDDLIDRLTLEEKVVLMQDVSKPVERLGIKEYNWWNEALHGVARSGLATVFPQPIGMAASFDPDLLFEVFNAVSDEARAKNSYYASVDERNRYQGLTMWTPTINIYRDPRWGRGIETYGEDPYLTTVMGVQAVKGLQGSQDEKHHKLHACAKHFAVHSGPEWNRHSFDVNSISSRDLWETYLPAFEALVRDANVREVMCAYNRFEGDPCCGSNKLLTQILRDKWGFDGVVVADCGAIRDFYGENAHGTHPDAAHASADAVLNGTDLDCGSSYRALTESVKQGLLEEKDLDVSLRRLLMARFQLGEMDDPDEVSWSKIPYHIVGSESHDELSLEMARKSMTLLTNKNNILPLQTGNLTVAVVGPNANDSIMQWGNYNGTPPKTITILEGIRNSLSPGDKLIYDSACGLVDDVLLKSAYSECSYRGAPGFLARYWNNREMDGDAVTTMQMSTPFNLCTSGATVFAPNVDLIEFSASYEGTFKPEKSGEVTLDFYLNGVFSLWVDGVEVRTARTNHGSRKQSHNMKVKEGESYDMKFYFSHNNGDAQLNFDIGYKEKSDVKKTLQNIYDADIVIFAGGISPSLEGEEMGVNLPGFKGGDRTDIQLPLVQREFIKSLKEAGKKVILVNCSGSPIGLSDEIENTEAILQAWYPGQAGGQAVADVIFGKYNPSGRLPVTFYRDTTQLPDFENYDMAGRTYRYLKKEPLFPFGHGLSYTQFEYGKPVLENSSLLKGQSLNLSVPVSNVGELAGEEVVQVYLRKKDDADGPVKALRDFKRVHFKSGETKIINFDLSTEQLEWWNPLTESMIVMPGEYRLFVGKNSNNEDLHHIDFKIK